MDERKAGKKGKPTIYTGEERAARTIREEKHQDQRQRQQTMSPETEREVARYMQQKKQAGGENVRRERTEEAASKNEQRKEPKKEPRRREREAESKMQILWIVLGVLVVILIAAIIYEVVLGYGIRETGAERMEKAQKQKVQSETMLSGENEKETAAGNDSKAADGQGKDAAGTDKGGLEDDTESNTDKKNGTSKEISAKNGMDIKAQADLYAQQYDYDAAIELLSSADGFGQNDGYQAAVAEYKKQKEACIPYPAEEVTHIFFHTLIHDAKKAFDGDEYEDGYNQFMVTEYEFNSIIRQMYDNGYVMVFISDFAPKGEDGTFAPADLMLPPDKIPFVLSQDDVSYYHYMDGDGYASRLIVDENGDVRNEYIEDDGSVSVGDYDMVPLIDRFVEEHPDFAYHGHKGYIALTGYEGILGYRTDEVYKTKESGRVTVQQQMFFDSYPGGFDEAAFEKECEGARAVAEAMKAEGWKFASHTWGHQNMNETNGVSWETFKRDTDRWAQWVEPLIGETDTLIYAFGGDIRGWEKYSGDRFTYLKESGFDYYCGVDSAKYWVQIEPNYVRQSRRNVDGYRMYYNPEMLSDLFDVQQAWDPLRPSYVPEI